MYHKYTKNDSRTTLELFYARKRLIKHLILEQRQVFKKWQNWSFCKGQSGDIIPTGDIIPLNFFLLFLSFFHKLLLIKKMNLFIALNKNLRSRWANHIIESSFCLDKRNVNLNPKLSSL